MDLIETLAVRRLLRAMLPVAVLTLAGCTNPCCGVTSVGYFHRPDAEQAAPCAAAREAAPAPAQRACRPARPI